MNTRIYYDYKNAKVKNIFNAQCIFSPVIQGGFNISARNRSLPPLNLLTLYK